LFSQALAQSWVDKYEVTRENRSSGFKQGLARNLQLALKRLIRVGFVRSLLTSSRVATSDAGSQVRTVVPKLPIKDGSPADYDPIFVTNANAAIVEDFATAGHTINLNWPDVPSNSFFINLLDNPSCADSGLAAQTMTAM